MGKIFLTPFPGLEDLVSLAAHEAKKIGKDIDDVATLEKILQKAASQKKKLAPVLRGRVADVSQKLLKDAVSPDGTIDPGAAAKIPTYTQWKEMLVGWLDASDLEVHHTATKEYGPKIWAVALRWLQQKGLP